MKAKRKYKKRQPKTLTDIGTEPVEVKKKLTKREQIELAYNEGKLAGIFEAQQDAKFKYENQAAPIVKPLDPRLEMTIKFMSNLGQTIQCFNEAFNRR